MGTTETDANTSGRLAEASVRNLFLRSAEETEIETQQE
jgi:hypothetical protein